MAKKAAGMKGAKGKAPAAGAITLAEMRKGAKGAGLKIGKSRDSH